MQPTHLLNAIQNFADLVANNSKGQFLHQDRAFRTLPLPWTIAQLLDEEDPNVI
ncbi:hypothetical protein [Argonema antarcticum]|uniref:hypothetical protein n=1 Tax=Argonema antarcticum TaxID=2942763 RepID=UPI002012CAB1|nr:hypothetical protein [Argonema antarcticum]MCL1474504.1 hypothetical protein [Argonema antarcticum A004/B2]